MQVDNILATKGSNVVTIRPNQAVREALAMLAKHNVGALVVADDELCCVGIISERDYSRKVILRDRSSKKTAVSEIMTAEIRTVGAATTVAECMELMTEHRIRHLPVLDDESKLAGVVSIGDVVKAVIAEQADLIAQLERYITT